MIKQYTEPRWSEFGTAQPPLVYAYISKIYLLDCIVSSKVYHT